MGFIIGSNILPKYWTSPEAMNSSDRIKKGRRDGRRILNQRFKPFLALSRALAGLLINVMISNRIIS
ncbi:MAG: hypothetical protein WAQ12_06520 [Tissierellaceae bacterium]|jgi:hypothetical protein